MKVYIGIDAHSTNYTLCSYNPQNDQSFYQMQIEPDYHKVVDYVKKVKVLYGRNTTVLCGYEAGCLGYTLYKQLTAEHIDCVIMAPSTITTIQTNKKRRRKNDKRDAEAISRALGFGLFQKVYVCDEQDTEVRDYIRIRDDHKLQLKKLKQQINAFCLRNGYLYSEGRKWTIKHVQWLRTVELSFLRRETLDEYLLTFDILCRELSDMTSRIEEFAQEEKYKEPVSKLRCLKGIDTLTALSLVVEISDFNRFSKADGFACYLGLVPGQDDSACTQKNLPITKAGNIHLRTLLIEAAQSYGRGSASNKSKTLQAKQKGNDNKAIAYADKAQYRLTKKYKRMQARGMRYGVITSAIARELSGFVWGMATNHIS